MQPKHTPETAGKVSLNCQWCSEPFLVFPSAVGVRKYCSTRCKGEALRSAARETFNAAVAEKACIVCRALLTRREDEEAGNYRNRKTCGGECGKIAAQMLRTDRAPDVARTCEVCGGEMHRRPNEAPGMFLVRKACSPECKARLSTIRLYQLTPPKQCVICGEQFVRRSRESVQQFGRRATCSKSCHWTYAVQQRRNGCHNRPYPSEFNEELKQRIRERDGWCCQLCGEFPLSGALAVHHIDYQKTNCHPDNLITLCLSCHSRTNGNREHWRAHFTRLMASRFIGRDAQPGDAA